jgi:hypothetical protein
VSDAPSQREQIEALDETPIDPNEVASAARSCSVLLIILAALLVIACVFGVIAASH